MIEQKSDRVWKDIGFVVLTIMGMGLMGLWANHVDKELRKEIKSLPSTQYFVKKGESINSISWDIYGRYFTRGTYYNRNVLSNEIVQRNSGKIDNNQQVITDTILNVPYELIANRSK